MSIPRIEGRLIHHFANFELRFPRPVGSFAQIRIFILHDALDTGVAKKRKGKEHQLSQIYIFFCSLDVFLRDER